MSEWRRTRLKFLAALPIRNGLGEPGTLGEPDWPRYIRTTDIAGPRSLRSDTFASLPPELAKQAPVHENDLLLSAAGTVGKSLLYRAKEPACYAGYLVRLRPRPTVDPRFLAYWTETPAFLDQVETGKVTSTIDNFSASKYQNLAIQIPGLEMQRAIADYLDVETARIDALIENKRRMVELLETRRMTVMADGVGGELTSPKLVPSALPWIRLRGATWPIVRLSLVAQLGSGHTPSRGHPEWWTDRSIPWITTGEVARLRSDRIEFLHETRESISEVGLANSAAELHPAGTVVLCRTASAGYSAIMGLPMATSQDFATWTCGPRLRPRFLLLCLRVMRQDLLGRLAMGSTHKTIYMPDIEGIKVPLPGVVEQDAIVEAVWARLHKIDLAMDALRTQLSLLTERRQALITAAVTGELAIPGVAA